MLNKIVEKVKKYFDGYVFRMFLSGLAFFVCALAFVPSAGVLRTIPLFVLGGAVSIFLGMPVKVSCMMGTVMTLCTYLVSGRSVSSTLLFAIASCFFTLSGVYIVKLFAIVKKSENKAVKKKAKAYILTSVLISLFLSFVLCGDAVSFVVRDRENTLYITEKYDSSVHKRYTCYEPFGGGYCTYVSLADGKDVYGNDDSLCIRVKNNVFNDDVRNYYENKMLSAANLALSEIVAGATYGFNVISSDISFDDGEVLDAQADVSDYLDRINYVISFDSLVGENEKEKFSGICADTVLEISRSGFEFGNIVFCAGDAGKVLFCAEVKPETKASEVFSKVSRFDENMVLAYGVTESDILGYWENK